MGRGKNIDELTPQTWAAHLIFYAPEDAPSHKDRKSVV